MGKSGGQEELLSATEMQDMSEESRRRRKSSIKPNFRESHINNREANDLQKFKTNYVSTTKYNVITFIPKNLFEQFQRAANVYFLVISIITFIPDVSPISPLSMISPLIFVLAVTAVKEAMEDWKRYRSDRLMNATQVELLDPTTEDFTTVSWADIKVGDMVKVTNKQQIPADLLMLSSSEPDGVCYIETSNLDGETNLKIHQCLTDTAEYTTGESLCRIKGSVTYEEPNGSLYTFTGTLSLNGNDLPINPKQVLLRGCNLRNTAWVVGFVLYTGHETKLFKNAKEPRVKRSNVEKVMNQQLGMIFIFQFLLCLFCAIASSQWADNVGNKMPYLEKVEDIEFFGLQSFLTFIVLFNLMVPISLYVSLEVVKVFQAWLIAQDVLMYHEETDTPAQARTSNLNEELGQVSYIFSDKTGTLTCNQMDFRRCSVGGISYGSPVTVDILSPRARDGESDFKEGKKQKCGPYASDKFDFDDPALLDNLKSGHGTAGQIEEFLTCLAVCHTVIPERDPKNPNEIVYQASSPDEEALVEASKNLGYDFHTRTPTSIVVNCHGEDKEWEILNILEFNSTRKRMTVICRNPEGKLKAYTKGADTVIIARLAKSQEDLVNATDKHLEEFAADGLRTLTLAVADLDEKFYESWSKQYNEAALSLVDREQKIDDVSELIEKEFTLIGATAIEDKLQDGVPLAIKTLARANIKLWVLTGDKQETAINIGFSCNLLRADMELVILNETTFEGTKEELKKELLKLEQGDVKDMALVIDGATLTYALRDELKLLLLQLGRRCSSVVCCRVSPLQKAQVVDLVKDNVDETITLAIGDGANDVSMIQAAHIGIGISGKEGMQAVLASDYAVAQFRFIESLLLKHGRWSYKRVSNLIIYFFYKNMALACTQFWYVLFCGYSGQTFYDGFAQSLYNVCFTSLPIMAVAIFDQDVSARCTFMFPNLYQTGQRKKMFNPKVFWTWVLSGIVHSLVCFFLPMHIFTSPSGNGHMLGMWATGTVAYMCIILTVTGKVALKTLYWTWINHFVVWGSVIFTVIFWYVYCLNPLDLAPSMYHVIYRLDDSPEYWLCLIICPFVCIVPNYAWKYVRHNYHASPIHIVQEIEKFRLPAAEPKSIAKPASEGAEPAPAPLLRQVTFTKGNLKRAHTGFAFSGESGHAFHLLGSAASAIKNTPRLVAKKLRGSGGSKHSTTSRS